MKRREMIKLSLVSGGALLLSAKNSYAGPDSHCTGGIFKPPSPPITPFVQELHRMPTKTSLAGGAADLTLSENGGFAPNGTVYPQVTGDDALTNYSQSLEMIVARQQRNSGKNIQFPPQRFYVLNARSCYHDFHPEMTALTAEMKGSYIWGYDGIFPGPTFMSKYGEPILVRIINELYDDRIANPPEPGRRAPGGFGKALISTHLHNGHTASESDGNPIDFYPPLAPLDYLPKYPDSITAIRFRDHHYAMFRAGLDPAETGSNKNDGDEAETVCTLWYHDHSMDFTAENVYKGLVGFHLFFDELDSGNENDPSPKALRLPSGDFDIPLLFQDKRFDSKGQLFLPKSNKTERQDGFLGDRFTVNGQIQPKLTVLRRKYRFRLLNAGPSRFYQFFLTHKDVDKEFFQISNDESLLAKPETVKSILISVAERADMVIDFSLFDKGDKLFLVNRLVMEDSGFGPKAEFVTEGTPPKTVFNKYVTLTAGQGDHVLCFEIGDLPTVPDQSVVPATLRAKPTLPNELLNQMTGILKTPKELKDPDDITNLPHREFLFGVEKRDAKVWAINKWGFNSSPAGSEPAGRLETVRSLPDGEVWTIKNQVGSNWAHPVHIHLEEFHILWRNGEAPPAHEQTKKDVLRLDPREEVQIFVRFRDFLGKYPIHCHNVIHEDHRMMLRFDVVGDR